MRIAYEDWAPKPAAVAIVDQANAICVEYQAQGYNLTLRQLYYQFVSRDLIPNNMQAYKRLGSYINSARMAGLLDWDYIVDRTRNLAGTSHWNSPADVIRAAASSYRRDKWADQSIRVEIWVEKEALAGVIERTAARLDLDWFACRGYVSQSEQWAAAQRFGGYLKAGQRVVILHLGDHDPSGIDMTRDIRDRLNTFVMTDWLRQHAKDLPGDRVSYAEIRHHMRDYGIPLAHSRQDAVQIDRIALNWDQIQEYDPPPNPAKLTDSRAEAYIEEHGDQSWELDALDPSVLDELITDAVEELRDSDLYDAAANVEDTERYTLRLISHHYPQVAAEFGDRE